MVSFLHFYKSNADVFINLCRFFIALDTKNKELLHFANHIDIYFV